MPRPRRLTPIRLSDQDRAELDRLVQAVLDTGQEASQGDIVAALMARVGLLTDEGLEAFAADVRQVRARIRAEG